MDGLGIIVILNFALLIVVVLLVLWLVVRTFGFLNFTQDQVDKLVDAVSTEEGKQFMSSLFGSITAALRTLA